MISTRLLADTPFRDLTAFRDFSGTLLLYHRALLGQVFSVTGKAYVVMPIGDGRGEEEWLQAVQQTHANAARTLGITAPPDLTSFDMSKEADHAAFFFAVSSDLERLRLAAGLS